MITVGPFQLGPFSDSVLSQSSSRSPKRTQAGWLPSWWLSITQNLTHKMQHELPLQVLGFSASATNPFLKQQPSFPFISHFDSTGPTRSQPVSSSPVSNCRVSSHPQTNSAKLLWRQGEVRACSPCKGSWCPADLGQSCWAEGARHHSSSTAHKHHKLYTSFCGLQSTD